MRRFAHTEVVNDEEPDDGVTVQDIFPLDRSFFQIESEWRQLCGSGGSESEVPH